MMISIVHITSACDVAHAAVNLARVTFDPDTRLKCLRIADQSIARAIGYVTDGPGHDARRQWLRWAHDLRRMIGQSDPLDTDCIAILIHHDEQPINALRHVRPA